jgi:glyoxylase-like metal-dependent hydrolase (beta-lactamase superfamily II)
VHQLARRSFVPAGLVISHRHVAGSGEVRGLADEFKIPVFIHPRDAEHPQATSARIHYENPVGHPLLEQFGIEAIHFPGHTAGHIVLYGAGRGGLLFTGDAAMGTTASQAHSGIKHLIRPPVGASVDDRELREQWQSFGRPVAAVLPYHGTGYMDVADLSSIMATLTREEPTYGFS